MKNRIKAFALSALLFFLCIASQQNCVCPDSISVFASEDIDLAVSAKIGTPFVSTSVKGTNATVKLFGVFPLKSVDLNVLPTEGVYLGGMAFGVKFFTEGVLVVGITDVEGFGTSVCPAAEAGIQKGDVLISINGQELDSAEMLKSLIEESGKSPVTIVLNRDGEKLSTVLYPSLSAKDNSYKAGLWVRDSTAGIGTVTYINANDGSFGGLGHGICDSETGSLMPLGRGVVVDVNINGIKKGAVGVPGELKGNFDKVQQGIITENTETGVYGKFDVLPENLTEPIPIGLKDELSAGKAFIFTTLKGNTPEKFEIEIEKIFENSGNTKNFLIKVVDSRLLDQTGGIVQGMSGSPIIQNGKIVGAVTHVLINDPTRGYGIFIENMLEAAA